MVSVKQVEELLARSISPKKKLVLFLDYDGTIAPIVIRPELAFMTTQTRSILENLSNYDNIFLGFITGRQLSDIMKMVGIKNVTYAGSHGFEIIFTNGEKYVHQVPVEDKQKIVNVQKALEKEVLRDGTWVEKKGDVLTFHYRETPEEKRPDLVKQAQNIIKSFDLDPTEALCGIEVQPRLNWNKGYAAKYMLESRFGMDWNEKVDVIFAGDDLADEKLMEMFVGKAVTFRISDNENVATAATMRLPSLEDIVTMLKWVEKTYKTK